MSKMKISLKIGNQVNNYKAILNKNKIIYKENDLIVTLIINNDNLVINRHNLEYEIELNFSKNKKTKGYYLLKKINKKLNLSILTLNLDINDKYIYVKYKIIESSEIKEFKYLLR